MKLLVIDADYTYDSNNNPIIRIFGKNVENGENVCLHVTGMEPYIYVGCSSEFKIMELKKVIEEVVKEYIKRIEFVKRFKPLGYQREKVDMLRLVLWNPRTTPEVRKILVEKIEGFNDDYIYEADILFRDRFLIDMGIDGMSVIEFNEKGKELKNYGLVCGKLYIIGKDEIRLSEESVIIEY